jgi:1,2-diacylglycerol 3-alpha-glucosyltransferase
LSAGFSLFLQGMSARPLKVVYVLINAYQYHVSRWGAFVGKFHGEAVMVEIASKNSGFDALAAPLSEAFERRTLFPGKTWLDVSGKTRRAAIRKALDELNPAVVCINGWSIGGAIASLEWAVERNRKVVLFSDSNQFDQRRYKLLESIKKRFVALADAALAGGTCSVHYLTELGMKSEQIFLGYDVIDNDHFASATSNRDDFIGPIGIAHGPYFLAAARFEEKKNHVLFLRAYAKFREIVGVNAWPLVLLGDGKLRREIEAERDRLGLGPYLILPGFVGYDDLPYWYRHAACLIHPSTTEQWGLVVNEAMASGLPVIVSDRCGCAPDLVENGRNGFTFNPYDVDELASLMQRIASLDCDRAAMGRSSVDIISRWSPETFALNLQSAVNCALRSERRNASLIDRILLRLLSHR